MTKHNFLPLEDSTYKGRIKLNKFGMIPFKEIQAHHIRRILAAPVSQRRARRFYISAMYFDFDDPKNAGIITKLLRKRTDEKKNIEDFLHNTWEFPTIFARELVSGIIEDKLSDTTKKPICRAMCTEKKIEDEKEKWTKGFVLFLDTRRHDSDVNFIDKWDSFTDNAKKKFLEYIIQLTMTALVYESPDTPARALLSDVLLSAETNNRTSEKDGKKTSATYINGFVLEPCITSELTRVDDTFAQTVLAECPQKNYVVFEGNASYSEYADILPYKKIPLPARARRNAYDCDPDKFARTRLPALWDASLLCDKALDVLKLKRGDIGYFESELYTRRFLELPHHTQQITVGFAREQTDILVNAVEDRLSPEDITEIISQFCQKDGLPPPLLRYFETTQDMAEVAKHESILFIDYSKSLAQSENNVFVIKPDGTYSEAKDQTALATVLFDEDKTESFDFYTRFKREHIKARSIAPTQGLSAAEFAGFFDVPDFFQPGNIFIENSKHSILKSRKENDIKIPLTEDEKAYNKELNKIKPICSGLENAIRKCIRELDIKKLTDEKKNYSIGMAETFEKDLIERYDTIVFHTEKNWRKKQKVSGSIILKAHQDTFEMPVTIGDPVEKPFMGYDSFWRASDSDRTRMRVQHTLSFGDQFVLAIENNESHPVMLVPENRYPLGYREMLKDEKEFKDGVSRSVKTDTILKPFLKNLKANARSQKADYYHSLTFGGTLAVEDIKKGVQLKFMKMSKLAANQSAPHIPRLDTFKGYRVLGNGELELLGRKDIDVLLDMAYFYISNMTFDVCISNETSKKTLLAKMLATAMYE